MDHSFRWCLIHLCARSAVKIASNCIKHAHMKCGSSLQVIIQAQHMSVNTEQHPCGCLLVPGFWLSSTNRWYLYCILFRYVRTTTLLSALVPCDSYWAREQHLDNGPTWILTQVWLFYILHCFMKFNLHILRVWIIQWVPLVSPLCVFYYIFLSFLLFLLVASFFCLACKNKNEQDIICICGKRGWQAFILCLFYAWCS